MLNRRMVTTGLLVWVGALLAMAALTGLVPLPWERNDSTTPRTLAVYPFCTGSMEPAITCLDVVTLSTDVQAEDIAVGDIISFSSPSCDMALTLHRVVEVVEEDGEVFFDTKGDDSPMPDGCRIRVDEIEGYVIDVERNVRPENAALRKSVNSARSAHKFARSQYDLIVERADRALALYEGLRQEHCPDKPDVCAFPPEVYSAARAAYQDMTASYDDLVAVEQKLSTLECALDNALARATNQYPLPPPPPPTPVNC